MIPWPLVLSIFLSYFPFLWTVNCQRMPLDTLLSSYSPPRKKRFRMFYPRDSLRLKLFDKLDVLSRCSSLDQIFNIFRVALAPSFEGGVHLISGDNEGLRISVRLMPSLLRSPPYAFSERFCPRKVSYDSIFLPTPCWVSGACVLPKPFPPPHPCFPMIGIGE